MPEPWRRKRIGEEVETTAMERYELRKLSKNQKFNIILEYNKLFQKVMRVYKWKICKELSALPKTNPVKPKKRIRRGSIMSLARTIKGQSPDPLD